MSYRRIDASEIQRPERSPLDRGPKPDFAWIRVANLRVNEAYQRPLKRENISAIRRIAEKFQWLKFGALRVAPIADTTPQLYSVVDGQHRATALALLGITDAPCIISEATEAQQAAAFAAINTSIVRVHVLTAFNAAIVAGDADALALKTLCADAGVTICPYPIQASAMKAGETLAVGTLTSALKRFGAPVLSRALKAITQSTNNFPGAVHANAVWALCEALSLKQFARATSRDFDAIELDTLDSDARSEKARQPGDTARARLRDKIIASLDAAAGKAAA